MFNNMEYGDAAQLCVLINAVLWILCFIYRVTCWAIKKIRHEETTATVGWVCYWIVFAILTSILGPVTLSIVTVIGLSWLLGTIIPWLWNHGLETGCEWLAEHVFSKSL